MANGTQLGTAYVNIIASAEGLGTSMADSLNGAAGSAGTSAGQRIASFCKKAISVAAIGAALTASIKEGAQYEQAVGGVETLFKESSDKVIQYANDAWQTAGVSANKYMEQSTSFAAALLQSVGGNTEKAAEAANTAIIDMADNANKMGTSLESIQNAYQGFAKQNYTMLDNLKLGYGGTKTEMERLLADAQEISGVKYDISNLSDVYDAIHVIQGELGITGTTALEAATTLSGSFASMQSAFSNFMAQLSTGGDVTTALSNLVDSAVTFVGANLIPALGRVVAAIPDVLISLIGSALPTVFDSLSNILDSLLSDSGMSAAEKFGDSLGSRLLSAIGKLIPSVLKLFAKLAVTLPSVAMRAATAFVKSLGSKLISGVKSALDKIKSAFSSVKLSLPHIKLPHFSISPAGWKFGDLLKGTIPHLSIGWYKTGGIFDSPSLIGVGEAGKEAVVPLSGSQMRPFAKAIAGEMNGNSGVTYNIGDVTLDVSSLEGIATVEQFVSMMKRAKAFA